MATWPPPGVRQIQQEYAPGKYTYGAYPGKWDFTSPEVNKQVLFNSVGDEFWIWDRGKTVYECPGYWGGIITWNDFNHGLNLRGPSLSKKKRTVSTLSELAAEPKWVHPTTKQPVVPDLISTHLLDQHGIYQPDDLGGTDCSTYHYFRHPNAGDHVINFEFAGPVLPEAEKIVDDNKLISGWDPASPNYPAEWFTNSSIYVHWRRNAVVPDLRPPGDESHPDDNIFFFPNELGVAWLDYWHPAANRYTANMTSWEGIQVSAWIWDKPKTKRWMAVL